MVGFKVESICRALQLELKTPQLDRKVACCARLLVTPDRWANAPVCNRSTYWLHMGRRNNQTAPQLPSSHSPSLSLGGWHRKPPPRAFTNQRPVAVSQPVQSLLMLGYPTLAVSQPTQFVPRGKAEVLVQPWQEPSPPPPVCNRQVLVSLCVSIWQYQPWETRAWPSPPARQQPPAASDAQRPMLAAGAPVSASGPVSSSDSPFRNYCLTDRDTFVLRTPYLVPGGSRSSQRLVEQH